MTCRSRSSIVGAAVSVSLLLLGTNSFAGELPAIKVSEANTVPACATPGRLMSFLKQRNGDLAPKFEVIATEYMRQGAEFEMRWDYAFFQMLLETGFLTYTGDVKPTQNNFAGLGATGGGARGESFKDVPTGVRAHLQHLLMYSGQKVENPVAERTRNIQEWGVLTSWQKTIKGPMTFTQLAKQWAPTTRGYARDIDSVAQRFFNGACTEDDPQPELVAEARGEIGGAATKTALSSAAKTEAPQKPAAGTSSEKTESKGAEATRRAGAEDGKSDGTTQRFALGASAMVTASTSPASPAAETKAAAASPPVKMLNAQPSESKADASVEVASVAGAAKDAGKPEAKADAKASSNGQCRVWTASYGGNKAIIIKATAEKTVNYTVLDVNEGTEKREADAYISAYAKGGEAVGEFPSQSQALEKAFELCPEG